MAALPSGARQDSSTDRERAALALTESLTNLSDEGVPEPSTPRRRRTSPRQELANLIGAIIAINAWNRVGVGLGLQPAPLAA